MLVVHDEVNTDTRCLVLKVAVVPPHLVIVTLYVPTQDSDWNLYRTTTLMQTTAPHYRNVMHALHVPASKVSIHIICVQDDKGAPVLLAESPSGLEKITAGQPALS